MGTEYCGFFFKLCSSSPDLNQTLNIMCMDKKERFRYEFVPLPLTYALILIILVYEDVVQDKVEQLVLQSAIRVKNQWLEALPATRSQLVTEDHQ